MTTSAMLLYCFTLASPRLASPPSAMRPWWVASRVKAAARSWGRRLSQSERKTGDAGGILACPRLGQAIIARLGQACDPAMASHLALLAARLDA